MHSAFSAGAGAGGQSGLWQNTSTGRPPTCAGTVSSQSHWACSSGRPVDRTSLLSPMTA